MTPRKLNTIANDHHASWENFGKYLENRKQNKPVVEPTRIYQLMKALSFHAKNRKVSPRASIAFAVLVEYILADLLENAGQVVIDNGDGDIDMKHVLCAIRRDPELSAIFVIPRSYTMKPSTPASKKKKQKSAE